MIVARIALLPVLPPPDPTVHDEFSYLLAADTFVQGRVANPPLRHPEFFESPHILTTPVYVSKYPPGQGMVLALGQAITGHPYWGVVGSVALMVFLFCWAANAWLPPRWTLLAGVVSIVVFFIADYWFSSYWGGAVAASGGALVVGGLGYTLRDRFAPESFGLGLGAVILYFSRPYEGGVLCLTTLLLLLIHILRQDGPRRRLLFTRVVLPNVAIIAAAAPAALWYNAGVTGDPLLMPYMLYYKQVDIAPLFWVQAPLPMRQYSNANTAARHAAERTDYERLRNRTAPRAIVSRLVNYFLNVLTWHLEAFAVVLLALPWVRVRKRKWFLAVLFAAGIGALLPEVWILSHYAAPFFVVTLILVLASARTLWYRMTPYFYGRLACGFGLVVMLAIPFVKNWDAFSRPLDQRARFARDLAARGGNHLVFVDYVKGWNPDSEWVYNGADLDSGPIIFAHDLGPEKNPVLIEEYPSRTAWQVILGPKPEDLQVQPYRP